MPIQDLKRRIARLPEQPGVYLYFNEAGDTLYVGKAKVLRDRARPCLEYDIRRCIAPCVRELCSEETYAVAVQDTRLFLEGRNEELIGQLRQRMSDAAAAERFEQAAQLRDALRTIETLQQRQEKMAGT